MKARSSREEPNIASIRSKSNYFQYSKKGLCQRWVQYGTTIFFLSNGFIHFEFSQSGLTTLMHVSIWRKSFVLQQLLGKYNQARKSTKFDPTVGLGASKGWFFDLTSTFIYSSRSWITRPHFHLKICGIPSTDIMYQQHIICAAKL